MAELLSGASDGTPPFEAAAAFAAGWSGLRNLQGSNSLGRVQLAGWWWTTKGDTSTHVPRGIWYEKKPMNTINLRL
jgi:hypothetical protein